MKRSNAAVPARETGKVAGDYGGSRPYMKMPTKGGRNTTTNEARRGAGGVAPRPQTSKAQYMSQSSASAPTQASLARVSDAGSSAGGSFTPVQNNALANLQGSGAGYGGGGLPPAARGGPSGLRAGGRNQAWPNGALYTDAVKRGSSGRDAGPVATRTPKRRGKGAAFYGEYPS